MYYGDGAKMTREQKLYSAIFNHPVELKDGAVAALEGVLSSLKNLRQERVIRLRYGLEDGQSRTLEEVGREFGVTRVRIHQIEAKTLRRLRHPSRSRKLETFIVEG